MINKSELKKHKIKYLDGRETQESKNQLFEHLKANFPETIKEGEANLKAIASLLGLNGKADIQGYELTFTGKGLANALYNSPCNKELKLEKIYHKSNNVIIRGDNLDVLKLLKSAYSEKIKTIYIDPPYNTANDNFIYPDNFRDDYKKILEEVGLIEYDENGEEIESETLRFFRNIQGSRTHSGWLSFMLPRLKLARDLLREDGVIFISIDDNEQANLKLLCDEVFGEGNFVADFIRKTKSTTNDAKIGLNYQHEFLLCYAKNKENVNLLGGEKDLSKYANPDNDPNGRWVIADPSAKSGDIKTGYFAVKNPYTGKEDYPPEGRFWLFSQNTIQKHIDEGRICFKKEHKENERGFIYKRYLKDLKTNLRTFDSLKFTDNAYMNQVATKELLDLGLGEYFSYPKGIEFMKEIIKHSTNSNVNNNSAESKEFPKELKVAEPNNKEQLPVASKSEIRNEENGDIVLDFFAGSGTTAQAVMELNSEDKGNRKFILVQLDEEIKEEKSKTAFDFCKKELKSKKPVISDITIERVKRAADKIAKSDDIYNNLGFKVYTLEDKPEIIESEDRILNLINKRNLSPLDIVINMSLISGKTLDKNKETIFEDKLYKCEDCFYLLKSNKEILNYLIKTQNEYIYIDAYSEDIELEDFLNLDAAVKERLIVVY